MSDPIALSRVLEILGDAVIGVAGPTNRTITHPAPIDEATSLAITFSDKDRAPESIRTTGAGAVLCTTGSSPAALEGKTLIHVAEPRLSFIRVIRALFTEAPPRGVHETAVVDPGAKVHPDAYVGPLSYIGDCEIGAGTVVHGGVHIYSGTRIGRNVVIHAGTVIGANGFIYPRNETGKPEHFPHVGGVIIEDGVEIGANACIDRATLTDTIIGEGTKIDNLVHIAHTVRIGRRSVIAAGAIVAGNTVVGNDVWIAPGVVVTDSIRIGDGADITLGSVVGTHVGRGKRMSGYYAVDHDRFLRAWHGLLRESGLGMDAVSKG